MQFFLFAKIDCGWYYILLYHKRESTSCLVVPLLLMLILLVISDVVSLVHPLQNATSASNLMVLASVDAPCVDLLLY